MHSHGISSPRAAELYFDDSFVGDVSAFIAAVAERVRAVMRHRRSTHDAAGPTSERKKPSLLDRLDGWFARQEQQARERYLADARDVFDLERRIDALDRGRATYY